jgi:sucrose-6-phosphate hydrolase SacC (GH32 family)
MQTASSHSRTQASFAAASQADIVHPPGASNNRNNSDPANTWLFSASVGACPAQYWLGQYSGGKFDLVNAMGPLALDGGDALYAPNVLQDKQVGGAGTLLDTTALGCLGTCMLHCMQGARHHAPVAMHIY